MRKSPTGVRERMQKVLYQRLESLNSLDSSTVHEVARLLCLKHPEYRRQKRQASSIWSRIQSNRCCLAGRIRRRRRRRIRHGRRTTKSLLLLLLLMMISAWCRRIVRNKSTDLSDKIDVAVVLHWIKQQQEDE